MNLVRDGITRKQKWRPPRTLLPAAFDHSHSTTPFRPINTKFEVTIDDEVDNDRDTVYLLTRRVGVAPALALCDSDSSDVVMWM
jgi:hypothetical protein